MRVLLLPPLAMLSIGCRTAPEPCAKAGDARLFAPHRFSYDDKGACHWRPLDGTPMRPFQCGELLIQLCPLTTAEQAAELGRDLGGTVLRNRAGPGRPGWIELRVARGREPEVVALAYADPRVEHASLNWLGVTVRAPQDSLRPRQN